MGKYIYLLIGESGSGKTTIANQLAELDGLKQLWSYTTRPPRWDGEPGHIFVDYRPLDAFPIAYTEFNGYEYWATAEQVEESDVYVVDPDGLLYFLLRYKGGKKPVVFFLDTTENTRRKRMKQRGDSRSAIRERIRHDRVAFRGFRESLKLVDDIPYWRVNVPNDDGDALATIRDMIHWFEEDDPDSYIV